MTTDTEAIAEATTASYYKEALDNTYNGVARLAQLGLSLPPEMRDLQTVINWPRLVVDSLEERLDIEGFRLSGLEKTDERLWGWWQANRLDEESSLGHTEALVQGQAAVFIGAGDDDSEIPLITVESLRGVRIKTSPRSGKVQWAARIYDTDDRGAASRAAVYRVGVTRYYAKDQAAWVLIDEIFHDLPWPTVVPLTNRARLADRFGRSEMADIIPIADAACRSITNLQGAQELLAVPSQYVFGATAEDFVDQDGNQLGTWEGYLGRLKTIEDTEGKVQQMPGADLRNFTEVIRFYAQTVSSLAGLPPEYLGVSNDNPSSADAIRMAETRLIKRAERRARAFGESWEQVMRIAMYIVDGKLPDDAHRLETVWRDPGTPTYASKVDAISKLMAVKDSQGRSLVPREIAWEDLGYSAEKQRRILALESDDPAVRYLAATDALSDVP